MNWTKEKKLLEYFEFEKSESNDSIIQYLQLIRYNDRESLCHLLHYLLEFVGLIDGLELQFYHLPL